MSLGATCVATMNIQYMVLIPSMALLRDRRAVVTDPLGTVWTGLATNEYASLTNQNITSSMLCHCETRL